MSVVGAFIVPHPPLIITEIGNGREKDIQKTIDAFEVVAKEIATLKPETIIISSPHATSYSDYFHIPNQKEIMGSFENFGCKEISFQEELDLELIQEIESISEKDSFPAGTKGETYQELDHGTMVPLYFIRKKFPKSKIVIVGLTSYSLERNYKMGIIIQEAIEKLNRKVVYIASGDLSHKLQEYGPYGYIEEGPIYDERVMNICAKGNFKELFDFSDDFLDKAAICGHPSFTIMAGVLDGIEVEAKLLSHETITGVGYGICTYHPKRKNPNCKYLEAYLDEIERKRKKEYHPDEYVSLAITTIYEYIKNKKRIEIPKNTSKELLTTQAGVFVSIHKKGELRGCIGTIQATTSCIAEEIIQNAISAATRDPRLLPITEEELPFLEINVDVLQPPEIINSKEKLNPKKYGVIVSCQGKRGLLLPDIEGINTVEEQIEIAKQKGNITEDNYQLERFEVIRHF